MPQTPARTTARSLVAIAGGLVFVGSLLYFAAQYLRGFDATAVPGTVLAPGLIIDVVLFSVFAMHHSLFARSGLKRGVEEVVSPELERSFYVWVASVLFLLTCAWWQPLPGVVWQAHGWPAGLLRAVQAAGAIFTVVAARHLDILDLSGIRQALVLPARRQSGLDDSGPYGVVRHPIYLAWMLFVWAAPFMNTTRFVFAATSTVYLIVAIKFEERDLNRVFGDAYRRYSEKVRWKLVPGVY